MELVIDWWCLCDDPSLKIPKEQGTESFRDDEHVEVLGGGGGKGEGMDTHDPSHMPRPVHLLLLEVHLHPSPSPFTVKW